MTLSDAWTETNFLGDLLRRLGRRKLLLTVQTVVIFLLLAIAVQMLPKAFKATSSVAIEGQTPAAVRYQNGGDALRDMPFDEQTIGTELAILKSRELLTDTIMKTGLLNRPEFNPSLRPNSLVGQITANLKTSLEAWVPSLHSSDMAVDQSARAVADTLDNLNKHLIVAPVPHSRVIEISVTANNPKVATQIANTIADLYISNHLEYKQAASRNAHEFLAGKIEDLRRDANQKAQAVEQYRIQHGLTTVMSATLIQEQLSAVSGQLQAARAQLADLEARSSTASKARADQLQAALASPTIQKLREQEAVLGAERAQKVASYGENSPMLYRINAQLGAVRSQINEEANRLVKSLPNDVNSARANVETLTLRMTELKKQAAEADGARARLTTLTDDATAARNVYTAFTDQLRQTDAAMAYGATDVRVISKAVPPTRASFPDQMIMLPAGLIVALMASCMTAYLTTQPKGLIGALDIETMFGENGIEALGMIPLKTARTIDHFETAIEQLLNKLLILDPPPKTIMITSAMPEEGKSTTARALAEAALRRGHLNVFLVDADMRSKPRLSAPSLGLGDVLRGDAHIEDVVTRRITTNDNDQRRLPVLPAGTPRGNPTSLMAMPSLKATLTQLREQHDLVFVDAPPAVVGGDCEMLARLVDTTVVLAKWRSTKPEVVGFAIKKLGKNADIAGMVLTMVDPSVGLYGQADAVIFDKKITNYYRS